MKAKQIDSDYTHFSPNMAYGTSTGYDSLHYACMNAHTHTEIHTHAHTHPFRTLKAKQLDPSLSNMTSLLILSCTIMFGCPLNQSTKCWR